jgi:transketolase
MKQVSFFKNKSNILRYELFKKMSEMQQGHPGSIFSILDFLTVLFYGNNIRYSKKKKKFTDKIILSKGHATSALYPILRDYGVISQKDWDNWGSSKKSKLRVFGNNSIPGIDITSGSLGHGLGVGAGFGMSFKKDKLKNNVYVIISEGELYEGSTWETLLFIKNYNLRNVKIIIDINNLIILGKTDDCMKLNPIKKKIEGFGFKTLEINGHDFGKLSNGIKKLKNSNLSCLLLNTVKGKGLSIMENKPDWHYWNKITTKESILYLKELGDKCIL